MECIRGTKHRHQCPLESVASYLCQFKLMSAILMTHHIPKGT